MVSPKNCRNASLVVPIDYICNSCNAMRTVNMSGVFCLETLLAYPQLELACRKLLHLSSCLRVTGFMSMSMGGDSNAFLVVHIFHSYLNTFSLNAVNL